MTIQLQKKISEETFETLHNSCIVLSFKVYVFWWYHSQFYKFIHEKPILEDEILWKSAYSSLSVNVFTCGTLQCFKTSFITNKYFTIEQ